MNADATSRNIASPSYRELLSLLADGERVMLAVGSDWASIPGRARFPLLRWAHEAHGVLDRVDARWSVRLRSQRFGQRVAGRRTLPYRLNVPAERKRDLRRG